MDQPIPGARPASSKMWGSRFHTSASPRAEAFGASINFDQRLWRHDIMGSAAHCRMLARQRIIGAEDARQILAGLAAITGELEAATDGGARVPDSSAQPSLSGRQLQLSPEWEDIHTWIEGRLRELIGEPASRLHTARSRNDQVALDLRMFARDAILWQIEALIALQRTLLNLAGEHPDTLMPGYTHLQRAQPVLFGHHLLAYVEMFQRDAQRLLDAYRRANVLPLGSGALSGVPYPIDRGETARLLAFPELSRNSIDAVADRDFVVEHLAVIALIATHLSRLAEELVLWSTAEFGFIRIADAHSTGSSVMPQKRNPDVAELIRAKTGRVYGHLLALLTVLKGLPLAYNKDLQEDKEALFDAVDTTLASTTIMAEMLGAVRVNTERMERAAGEDFSTATEYADYLAKKGMPFREAHDIVGQLVRRCESRGWDLADLSLAELQVASPLFEADAVGLRPADAAGSRQAIGGTAPPTVAAARAEALARLEALAQEVARRREALPSPDHLLNDPLELARFGLPVSTLESGPESEPRASEGAIECRVVSWRESSFALCSAIRMEVFVGEQQVPPELEMDDLDAEAIHVLALLDGAAVGTGRLILAESRTAKIGRMAVLQAHRGRGVGSVILRRLMALAAEQGVQKVSLASQLHAVPFYERFGFVAHGDIFLEAGIQHRWMDRAPAPLPNPPPRRGGGLGGRSRLDERDVNRER